MSDATPEEAMEISMMDGFITALALGPNLMMPSSMLSWIWDAEHGEESPRFASAEESRAIVSLILRHWNNVNDTLNNAPDEYASLILERETPGGVIPIIDEWLDQYNNEREHQGRWCYGKTPMRTFLDSLELAREKLIPH